MKHCCFQHVTENTSKCSYARHPLVRTAATRMGRLWLVTVHTSKLTWQQTDGTLVRVAATRMHIGGETMKHC